MIFPKFTHFINTVRNLTTMAGTDTSGDFGKYDDHSHTHQRPTVAQLACGIIWLGATIYYVVTKIFKKRIFSSRKDEYTLQNETSEIEIIEVQKNNSQVVVDLNIENTTGNGTLRHISNGNGGKEVDEPTKKLFSKVPPPPDLDKLMQHIMTFGCIMIYFFLCDYIKIFPSIERSYVRDTFLFLVFLLFLVGIVFSMKPTADKILNRDQTEEWKGWMQVMFVWYHYFAAKEWYNWIRIYIAAYVWMTGFGNFSFFWVKKDFSPWRVMKMLFRLNFMVICVCVAVKNEYMLYYICAMHTYWFLSVYAFMGILPHWNTHRYKMIAKFIAYAFFNAIIFEIPGVHMEIFRPFRFVFGMVDGKHDVMHEWAFRSGLDHWVCFIGMICAYNYPYFENLIKHLESPSHSQFDRSFKLGVKVIMVFAAVLTFIVWQEEILAKDKYDYNAVHPYTSWVPIIVFIVLRNIHPYLRTRYIGLFAWLGKITLETYLSQLHIYLQSNAKDLIGYIPGYPLLSFSLATIIYLFLSHLLFNLTTEFSAWLFPKDYKEIAKKCGMVFLTFSSAGVLAYLLDSLHY